MAKKLQINPVPGINLRTILAYCTERDTLVRSIKTALVIGTILAIINHGQDLLTGHFSPQWVVPMLITYLVPFTVATYGQIQGKRQRDRLQANNEKDIVKPV
ncbi:MAG TPA: nitrate/nitrite transporter NrtS [Ktedonobacteraceae bacterium]|nr:nitrate/nitrite transporter NrtS [Ktedonobacteraceae bacterium]